MDARDLANTCHQILVMLENALHVHLANGVLGKRMYPERLATFR